LIRLFGEPARAGPYSPATPQSALPRWRGFNLLDLFQALPADAPRPRAGDEELRWIRDWGFNFIRIPMDYWLFIDSDWRATGQMRSQDVRDIREIAHQEVDRILDLGRRYGLHVSLNFHRAPGYCVNDAGREPFSLWSEPRAQDAFVHHWDALARRYRAVSGFDLSFNLLNEPPAPRPGSMSRADYVRVMQAAIDKIRETSPHRPILVDGLDLGTQPVEELADAGAAQNMRGYWPPQLTHYLAPWVEQAASYPPPEWPGRNGRRELEARLAPWGELARQGVGVHCGECGCFNKTPHPVFLAWLADLLEILDGHGIGYALWNFRGSFGILDSGRQDVDYQDWYGRLLDRKLLRLLQEH
jgi:aryl-phospho-beta-D-glucosidase BglC (GH1 family)